MHRVATLLISALFIISGFTIYIWRGSDFVGFNNASNESKEKTNEAKILVAEISKFLILPTDEEPTVATVSDLTALQNQPFFSNAKIGDKVLIYSKSKKAILYNPILKKIIEIAPINLGNSGAATSR